MDLNVTTGNQNVYHRGVYKVLFKSLHIETKKDLTFTIEMYPESSNFKIIISEERDPCFLCVLCLTRSDYDDLKKQQGLLIDFDSFPQQFVRLLQHSVDGNMFLTLQQNIHMGLVLDVVEHNEFKRLVHLSLMTGPASDSDIKKNMAQNVLTLKKKISELSKKVSEDENMFREKEGMLETKVRELNMALCRMQDEKIMRETEHQDIIKKERDKLDEERREWKKCAELHSQTQVGSMQEALSRKEMQLDDVTLRCNQLQDTIKSLESQIMDKGQRILNLEKQLHTARADAENWRTQNASLDREYHDKEINLQHTRTKLLDVEKNLKDKSDMLREALDSLQSLKREKNVAEERAATLDILSSKHKTEAQSTAEQLMKANQIISKLNNDLIEMREKLMCRTAIALEQEKIIEKHSLEMERVTKKEREQSEENKQLRTQVELAKLDFEKQERLLCEKEEIIQNNNTVIRWLHKKIDSFNSHDTMSTTNSRGIHNSTPFLSSNNNISDKNTGENNNDIINAYSAGLNLRSVPERICRYSSPTDETTAEVEEKEKMHYGLDPVYLRPVSSARSKSQDSSKSNSAKEVPLTSRSNKTTAKTLSTNRSSKSSGTITAQPKKSCYTSGSNKKSDINTNPLSPISAYFSRS